MSDSPEKTPIRGSFATPDEEAWHTFRRQSEQETPKRLEEAAKYLSGLVSIVFAIFLSAESGVFQKTASAGMTGFVCIVWLAALVATLFVIFPLHWRQVSQSAADIERVHRESVQFKYRLLALGVVLFLFGMVLLVWVFVGGA